MKSGASIFYFDILEDYFWSTHSSAVAIGNPRDLVDIFGFENDQPNVQDDSGGLYTIFDTGATDIFVSQNYYQSMVTKIFEKVGGKDYRMENGKLYSKCYNNFPNIFFAIKGRWIELSSEDYVSDISQA